MQKISLKQNRNRPRDSAVLEQRSNQLSCETIIGKQVILVGSSMLLRLRLSLCYGVNNGFMMVAIIFCILCVILLMYSSTYIIVCSRQTAIYMQQWRHLNQQMDRYGAYLRITSSLIENHSYSVGQDSGLRACLHGGGVTRLAG